MSKKDYQKVLRLRKKHAPGQHERPGVGDGERLANAQSVRHAVMAALIVIILFSVLWSMLTVLLGRVLPWMTLLLGIGVSLAVRRGGQGIDWRFPALAAVMAFVGAILANVVVAAGPTADEFDISTLQVLASVTTMTWPIFFTEVMTTADWIFAFCASGLATFFATRKLSRRQYQAVRMWQEQNEQNAD